MSTKPKVLIVDDEAGIRESLGSILRDEHYEVAAVGSAEEALHQIPAGDFEVGRPVGAAPGSFIDVPVAMNFGPLPLEGGKRYVWELNIDGETNAEQRP